MKKILLLINAILLLTLPVHAEDFSNPPFGHTIFSQENISKQINIADPNRLVGYGDRILLRTWGAKNTEILLMVDADGSIFIPEIGPVKIINQTMSQAQRTIENSIFTIYNDNVNVYATLADVKPISIFITGNANSPGRFDINSNDSVLDAINKAGGINPYSGSYREINIVRNNKVIQSYDLYSFLKDGQIENFKFSDQDILLISDIKNTVTVTSGALNNFKFEFKNEEMTGKNIIEYSQPIPTSTHVEVKRTDLNNRTVNLTLDEFKNAKLISGDEISFYNDNSNSTISVSIEGATDGNSQFSIDKTTSLKELLSLIRVDTNFADIESIYIKRKSVAIAQKQSLNNSLFRLQQATLRKQPQTEGEAKIRTAEAEMINNFVETAKNIEFDGKVVINFNGQKGDLTLEDGDQIVIPQKTNVIMISGEVTIPNAFIYSNELTIKDYVFQSGGFTENANLDKIVINHRDGTSTIGSIESDIKPGDNVIIMPKINEKEFVFAKELIGVIYQLAVGANILLTL